MTVSQDWARALSYTKGAVDQTLPGLIDDLARIHTTHPALCDNVATISYTMLARRMNRCARWAASNGLKRGDVVCLLMPNSIDYAIIWLGLTRIGCVVALLNTNLHEEALAHCIRAAEADHIIVSGVPLDGVPPIKHLWLWAKNVPPDCDFSGEPLSDPPPHPDDRALLIYTSGTTGFPKATIITHRRIVEWSYWFAGMTNASQTDCLYNCLPMYHSVGGVVAVGSMLVMGGSVVIRDRFSASRFWDDVVDYRCTIFQYIGELCRYLTLREAHPKERQHQLRLACGNGLQGDIWPTFQERFAIPQILEFYAATEGNLSLYNVEGEAGAIGRIPPFLAQHFAVVLIHCDPETGEPLRANDGYCVRCQTDEPGEAISPSTDAFAGYTDPDASQRKILRDVFAIGDRWFRSGDLMRKDSRGYYYFLDRLGDTFRWKGENVSTTEVTTVLRSCAGVTDAVVYGVAVPGAEGRAGMAALVTDDTFDWATLADHLEQHLPDYARPVYVRLCDSLDATGTFKPMKTELMRAGYEGAGPLWHLTNDRYIKTTDKYLNVESDRPPPVGS